MKQGSEIVVITGASAGVGRATAEEFARKGARLGLLARGEDRLEDCRRAVEALGGQAVTLAADVASPESTERIAAMTEEAFGPIDIWVNNAMASVYSTIWEMPPEEFRRVTDVTYLGYVYGTQAALRRMLPRNRGTIVQVGSALAYRAIPRQSAYCAAKYAIRGFTDSLRSELLMERKDIHVTMVQLPAVNTPQFVWVKSRLDEKAKPPGPIYQPEVAARAIHWAAHQRRREVYLGRNVSLGIKVNKVIPGFLDGYLVGRSFTHTGEPRDPDQKDNLWDPAPGNWGAHGPFDADAEDHSWQFELSKRRETLAWASLGIVGAVGLGLLLSRRQDRRRPGNTRPRQGIHYAPEPSLESIS